ncbi:MAG TPA: TIR domain-containing protein [Thermoanaerobaculia bacterium]|nr:TIR domain-containing protein [Thermoanaerobaculia bacterium]
MAQFTTVFLSSTPRDLQPYRDAVSRAIAAMDRRHGVRMQDSGARDGTPEEVCRMQVAAADVYVGVIGHLHGSGPSGSDLSYTELEYDEAAKQEKPRLLFLAAEDLPLAPTLREPDEMWQRQRRFRAKILTEPLVETFREPGELAAMVVAVLQRHQAGVAGRAEAAPEIMPKETPTTFFSYSREDSEFSLRLALDLRQKGARIWLDQLDIGPGQRWDSAVEEALRGSPRQVAILSPAAVSSENVMDEVSFALKERKQIIPVLYRDCQVPLRLHRLQYIDFRTDYDRGLCELLKALGVREQAGAPKEIWPPPQGLHDKQNREATEAARRAEQERLKHERQEAASEAGRRRLQQEATEAARKAVDVAAVAAAAKTQPSSKKRWIPVGAVGVLAAVLGILYMVGNRSPAKWKEVSRLTHDGAVNAVAFSADVRYVATASDDKTARVFEAASGKEVARLTHEDRIFAVAFSSDGRYVATGSADGTARVFEAASGTEVARLTHQEVPVLSVAFSSDGRYLVTTTLLGQTARVFEAASGKEVARLTNEGWVIAVIFSSDGRYLATGSDDKTARVFEAASGKEVARLTHEGAVIAVAFTADGRYVATGSGDKTARVFEAATGKEVARLTHEDWVRAVAFSADGRYVATGSDDKTARVFEAASGKEVARLTHEGRVSAVVFSADGRYVATASHDKTARVFEAASGKEVARLTQEGRIFAVAFSADGRCVATGSDYKAARVFEAQIKH